MNSITSAWQKGFYSFCLIVAHPYFYCWKIDLALLCGLVHTNTASHEGSISDSAGSSGEGGIEFIPSAKGGFEMYSAKEAAEMTGLTTATLRYYEKEQLLLAIGRKEQRYRRYSNTDIEWVKMVQCLRMANVPIRSIREYILLLTDAGRKNYFTTVLYDARVHWRSP